MQMPIVMKRRICQRVSTNIVLQLNLRMQVPVIGWNQPLESPVAVSDRVR
jgi:hypothetical protein